MEETGVQPRSERFDLVERTAAFGAAVIQLARQIQCDDVSGPIVRQLIRAATSIGANYAEADEAGSNKEFRYRISLCAREARETQHWIRMLVAACPEQREQAADLWQEAKELTLIFGAIKRKSKPLPK